MYKVLKEVIQDHEQGKQSASSAPWWSLVFSLHSSLVHACLFEVVSSCQVFLCSHAEMQLGGRVSEASAKSLLAKQLGEFANNLDAVGFLDVKTGRINSKRLV